MGLFDFFVKETPIEEKKSTKKTNRQMNFGGKTGTENRRSDENISVRVFKPTSFDDVCEIIDFLLLNKPAVVNMEAVKDDTTQRVMDILSGACYALHGDISEISQNIYLISPDGQVI